MREWCHSIYGHQKLLFRHFCQNVVKPLFYVYYWIHLQKYYKVNVLHIHAEPTHFA
jgi:hypothetical protein